MLHVEDEEYWGIVMIVCYTPVQPIESGSPLDISKDGAFD